MAEPVGPNNAIGGLERLSYDHLLAPPYDDVSFNWSHRLAQRLYPYIDSAGHDWVGRSPLQVTAKWYFLNSLEESAFPERWDRWRELLFSSEARTLAHPVLGRFHARVVDCQVQFDAKTRSGVIATVSWVETLKDPNAAQEFKPSQVNITKVAAKADDAMAAVQNIPAQSTGQADTVQTAKRIKYPDGLRTDSLLDLARLVDSALFSANLTLSGAVTQAQGIVEGIVDLTDNVNDHTAYALRDLCVQMWNGLQDIGERAGADTARATGTISYAWEITIDAAAEALGNTTTELIGLNLSLVSAATIPPGTIIIYYTEPINDLPEQLQG
jgi:hypothetical protein